MESRPLKRTAAWISRVLNSGRQPQHNVASTSFIITRQRRRQQ